MPTPNKWILNPKTGRLILKNGPTYNRLMNNIRYKHKIKNRKGYPKSKYKRWNPPKTKSERKNVYHKCGPKCFLDPKNLKFPICKKNSCKISKRGLSAAYSRASQWNYSNIKKKAKRKLNA